MKFHHEFTVPAGRERAWAFLMDVPGLASCIPGVENLRPAGPDLWDADVTAKIGPIAARFGCRVQVVSLDEAAGTGVVAVTGRDAKLGSGVSATMTMRLAPDGPGTRISVDSDVDVMGKIGQYGHGMFARRADAMIAELEGCARARLGGA